MRRSTSTSAQAATRRRRGIDLTYFAAPAKTGIQLLLRVGRRGRIPAFAGMTKKKFTNGSRR
jgi:hypothetical protein